MTTTIKRQQPLLEDDGSRATTGAGAGGSGRVGRRRNGASPERRPGTRGRRGPDGGWKGTTGPRTGRSDPGARPGLTQTWTTKQGGDKEVKGHDGVRVDGTTAYGDLTGQSVDGRAGRASGSAPDGPAQWGYWAWLMGQGHMTKGQDKHDDRAGRRDDDDDGDDGGRAMVMSVKYMQWQNAIWRAAKAAAGSGGADGGWRRALAGAGAGSNTATTKWGAIGKGDEIKLMG